LIVFLTLAVEEPWI